MTLKPLLWVSSSKSDLQKMPEDVQADFGYGLHLAQLGERPYTAKVLSGFGGASVLELKEDHKGDTFRAVYTVIFTDAIFVLHVFQKKSKSGITTPKKDIELIHSRLKLAEDMYRKFKLEKGKAHE